MAAAKEKHGKSTGNPHQELQQLLYVQNLMAKPAEKLKREKAAEKAKEQGFQSEYIGVSWDKKCRQWRAQFSTMASCAS